MTSVWLTRASVGRHANIGDLYDIRTDCFCGRNAFDDFTTLPLFVKKKSMKHTELSMEDSLHEKLTKLGIERELQLSLVANLAKADDYAATAVWHEKKADCQSSAAYISYRLFSVTKEIDLSAKEQMARMISTETLRDCNATHFVAAVSYGKEVIVHLERAHNMGYTPEEIQQQLTESLAKMKRAMEDNARDQLAEDGIQYSVHIFSNLAPPVDGEMMDVGDLHRYLSALDKESDTENLDEKPLKFTLIPVHCLREGLDHTLGTSIGSGLTAIDGSIVEKAVRNFESLTYVSRQVKCLVRDFTEHDQYISKEVIDTASAFDKSMQEEVEHFQNHLAKITVDVRAGLKTVNQIDKLLEETEEVGNLISRVQQFITSSDSLVEKIAFSNALTKEGVLCLANHSVRLDEVVKSGESIVLFANEQAKLKDQRAWKENCQIFFHVMRVMKRKSSKATFVYVSCDEAPPKNIDDIIAVRYYKNGTCMCPDVAERLASLSVAESAAAKQPRSVKPRKTAPVNLKCPGSLDRCDTTERPWRCKECLEQLEYGYDDYFYCSCGKRLAKMFKFHCNNPAHGREFLDYPQTTMKQHLDKMQPLRELNILLLGETGVGKSTWVNGFANYLIYPTLDEAELGETICLIPSSFTMVNENYEETLIRTGVDLNEDHKPGQSSTQLPQTYVFRHANFDVRIIDTPGIGDTRGIDQDKTNMQNILTHLSSLDYINGIIVLLKPNNSRLNVMFSFCINELLAHLHRDTCKNIVYCFTNTRGTFYLPGETLPALRTLLYNQGIEFKLNKKTIYCFDNEAIRFLAAVKQGVKFGDTEKRNYSTSWEKSVTETVRLFERITKLAPHKIKNTLSLNEARRLIVELTRPLAEISAMIQNNINVIEERENEIRKSKKHKKELVKTLYIPIIDLQITPLDHPRTVCTSSSCVKNIDIEGVKKTDYITHCHPRCYLPGVQSNIVSNTQLLHCSAMSDGTCKICGCSWSFHMHITYDCGQVLKKVADSNVEKQIQVNAGAIETIKNHLQTLRSLVKEHEDEKKVITEVGAKFACFLKQNAITPYNDSLGNYLKYLIHNEKERASANSNEKTLAGLENMLAMYENEKRILDCAIKEPSSEVRMPTPDDIKCLAQTLYELKFSGSILREAMPAVQKSHLKTVEYSEKRFTFPQSISEMWTSGSGNFI